MQVLFSDLLNYTDFYPGYCGNFLGAGAVLTVQADCSFTCPGNSLEYCGAGNRLEMYKLTSLSSSTGVSSSSTSTSRSGTVRVI